MSFTARRILENRLALSTVVTTLIVLVISVLLAGTVTYFAINVSSTRVLKQKTSTKTQLKPSVDGCNPC
jgi:flagellar basal body-associated protein FliL